MDYKVINKAIILDKFLVLVVDESLIELYGTMYLSSSANEGRQSFLPMTTIMSTQ